MNPSALPWRAFVGAGSCCLALLVAAPAASARPLFPRIPCVGPQSDTWLNITIEHVRSDLGQIAVTLYPDDASQFLAPSGSLFVGRVPAHASKTKLCIYLPHPGIYALAAYHDEDNSGSLKRVGPLGLPAYGFGFSNNPNSIATLLAFKAVRLSVPRPNLSTHIKLRYP